MKSLALSVLLCGVASTASLAGSETFRTWRTAEGSIYVGNTPPEGSALLEEIELPLADPAGAAIAAAATSPGDDAHARAAEDGRKIMRERAVRREAARDRELALELSDRELAASEPPFRERYLYVRPRPRHHHHPRPPFGIGPSPPPGYVAPDTRAVLSAPRWSAPAPPFRTP